MSRDVTGSGIIRGVAASSLRRLDMMIEESTLISLEVLPESRRVRLRLHVPDGSDPATRRGDRVIVLHDVSRVAAVLRVRHRPGAAPGSRDAYSSERLPDVPELNDWLRLWSGYELSGQPAEIFDGPYLPAWLDWASLDLVWPDDPAEVHALHLWLADNASAGGRALGLWVEFGHLEVVPGTVGHGRGGRGGRGPGAAGGAAGGRGPSAAGRAAGGRGPGRGGRGPGRDGRATAGRSPRRRGLLNRNSRRRVAAVAAAVVCVALVAFLVSRLTGKSGTPPQGTANPHSPAAAAHAAARSLPAAESGLLPWHLAVPISREAVLPGPQGQLIILGGLTAGGTSASGVFAVHPVSGAVHLIGTLKAPVHDAAAAAGGGRLLVFGGGSPTTVATVQAATLASRAGGLTATAAVAGSMPAPRSDAAAVSIGQTTYIVGGYTGTRPDAQVLATTNGRTFTTVATLKVPVRYPAVAALGGTIYVFGGQAISGPQAGKPLNVIQAVDPARRTATVAGHLPEPLAGAVAVTVGGELFVAGGDSSPGQHLTRGLGTTQLAPGLPTPAASAATTVSAIWAFNPATKRLLRAGRLQVPVSHAGVAVVGSRAWIIGGESDGTLVSAVQMLHPDRAFGTAGAPGAGSPYFGYKLLVADRGNNRLLLLSPSMQVLWRYPAPNSPPDRLGFYFPDDAFFVDHGTAILSNQEQNETIVKIAYPSGKITWSYGHPGKPGTAPGYLHEPDDAYLLRSGQVSVADAINCRVLVLNANGTVAHQIGTTGVCVHNPPASLGSPNGDTPLADGNLLISEINGSWVSEYTLTGKLVWTTHLPISYPSDPQQLGSDRYLIADYTSPGAILEFNRSGRILYRYQPTSGPGMLNHPSLAEMLPSGVFLANDDYNDRVVAIDPATGALVWQYGITATPGTGPGMLNTPDGFDLLGPNGSTPTHPATG